MNGVRKAHVRVEQEVYLETVKRLDSESPGFVVLLEDIAEHLDVSVTTAYHKMEGLAFQGLLDRVHPGYKLRHIQDPL